MLAIKRLKAGDAILQVSSGLTVKTTIAALRIGFYLLMKRLHDLQGVRISDNQRSRRDHHPSHRREFGNPQRNCMFTLSIGNAGFTLPLALLDQVGRRTTTTRPSSPEPNSQSAAGSGIGARSTAIVCPVTGCSSILRPLNSIR